MTVGESVYQQAINNGYSPAHAEGLVAPLNNVAEAYQRISETVREPLNTINSVVERMRPQLDTLSRMSFPIIPPSIHREDYISLKRPVQEVRIMNPEDITPASTKRISEYVISSYLLPQNATWGSLDMQFIDGHFVRVSYPGMESKKFDFKDMGFINTKTNRSDLKWALLRAIAENSGALTNEKWNRRFSRNVKYELNEGLKQFFGMEKNPIPHYTKRDGYRPLFSIRPER